jgi:hypothetical protein
MRLPTQPLRLWLISASGVYAALLVLTRGFPTRRWDAGIFLSVGTRLVHGDSLYVDVLDNKDPLFYYSYAGALAIGDWRAPFLLDVVWLAVAAASAFLLLRTIGASRLTAAVGFIAYPFLLTAGLWYYTGHSMLAALAFVPLIGWLWIRGRFALAGALLCVGLLFKANLALLLATAPLTFLLLGLPAGPARSKVSQAAAGFGAALAMTAGILAVRGELVGYIDTLIANVGYSADVLEATGRQTGILGHVVAVAEVSGGSRRFVVAAAAFFLVSLLAIWTLRQGRARRKENRGYREILTLAALFLSATATTAVTLALTGVWDHHLQMVAYPGLMLFAFLVVWISELPDGLPKVAAACATAGLAAGAIAGTHNQRAGDWSISPWLETGRSKTAGLLERAAADRFPRFDEITYAHLGSNDEDAMAAFLDREFVLACPMIAQYYFSANLSSMVRCIRAEKPCLILVTPSFTQAAHAPTEWNRFVYRGSRLLSRRYEHALKHETETGAIEVFTLRESSASSGCTGPVRPATGPFATA